MTLKETRFWTNKCLINTQSKTTETIGLKGYFLFPFLHFVSHQTEARRLKKTNARLKQPQIINMQNKFTPIANYQTLIQKKEEQNIKFKK